MSEHELWNELGNLYFLSGSYGQAVFAYRRSIQMDGTFGQPYSNLALTYVQQGKFDEALDLYRRSIELLLENKEKALSWNRLGNVYRYLKDYRNALVAYQRADELDPENAEAEDRPGWVADPDARAAAAGTPAKAAPAIDSAPPDVQVDAASPEAFMSQLAAEDFGASWAVADLSDYQQDVSAPPGTNPLTAWGEPEFDDGGPDPWTVPDGETDVYIPDADSDDLTKWLPIPDEGPQDTKQEASEPDELPAEIDEVAPDAIDDPMPEFPAEEEPPAEDPVEPPQDAPSRPQIELPIIFRRDSPTRYEPAQQPVQAEAVVEVEERPAPEFVIAVDQSHDAASDVAPPRDEAPPASEAAANREVDVGEPTPAAAERGAEELQQIEADLAKYQRVVQVNPRNAHAWDTLGNLYKTAGRYSEALAAYQQAVSNDPKRSQYHHHLGLLYACEGRMEDAVCAFQRVIEIDPDHYLAHATLGGYYRKMGLEELAQKHIGKAMKSIFDSENEYNRACLAAICGRADEALELLRVALTNKQTYVDWILRDPDLDFIRQDPRFRQLISDYTR